MGKTLNYRPLKFMLLVFLTTLNSFILSLLLLLSTVLFFL